MPVPADATLHKEFSFSFFSFFLPPRTSYVVVPLLGASQPPPPPFFFVYRGPDLTPPKRTPPPPDTSFLCHPPSLFPQRIREKKTDGLISRKAQPLFVLSPTNNV